MLAPPTGAKVLRLKSILASQRGNSILRYYFTSTAMVCNVRVMLNMVVSVISAQARASNLLMFEYVVDHCALRCTNCSPISSKRLCVGFLSSTLGRMWYVYLRYELWSTKPTRLRACEVSCAMCTFSTACIKSTLIFVKILSRFLVWGLCSLTCKHTFQT